MLALEIGPAELKAALDEGKSVKLVDCREPFEHEIARLPGAVPIPMNSIPANLQSIEAMADEGSVVVYCHHGMRSLNVVSWLRGQGIENCQSLAGGIDLWSRTVDSGVPRY